MATSEEDRLNPGKKSAVDTGEVGDGQPPFERRSPPWQPENPEGKDRPKPVVQKAADATGEVSKGKAPTEHIPTGRPGNPKGKDRPKPVAKKSAKATRDVGYGKAPTEKHIPTGRPGNPRGKGHPKPVTQKSANAKGDVGYGKPPIDKRFKPGESGNSAGRPLGAKNKVRAFGVEQLKETALAELYREIETTEGDEKITLPAATLILRRMVQKGADGDPRAALIMLTMGQNIEREKKAEQLESIQFAVDYKKGWAENFAYCKDNGLPLPEVIPHPDHVIINYDTLEVTFNGPCSAEEKTRVDDILKRKANNDKEIAELEAELRGKLKAGYRKFLEECLADAKWVRGMIEKILPDWALTELQKPPGRE